MPTDLSAWFGVPTILAWIEQEIRGLAERNQSAPVPEAHTVTLRLLSFAYLTHLYASEEIATQCRTDELFQRLCCRATPFADELRRFRRNNVWLLQKVLSGVFIRAILRRFSLVTASLPEELSADLDAHARARLNIARHLDAGEE